MASSIIATPCNHMWNSGNSGVMMSNVARAAWYAKLWKACRNQLPSLRATDLCPVRRKVLKNIRTQMSFSNYVKKRGMLLVQQRNWSVPISWRLTPKVLGNILSLDRFEFAFVSALIIPAIFYCIGARGHNSFQELFYMEPVDLRMGTKRISFWCFNHVC